eukprot:GILJ01000603.1.p1 GENE.GILJ01000603.1~~GILJ01000603.1.p1  ORF type:complete len:564 (+),score=99.37 GILJ01000603.1:42-1694(+)
MEEENTATVVEGHAVDLGVAVLLLVLVASLMGGLFLKKKHSKYLQEAGLATLIGVFCGLLLKLSSRQELLKPVISFNEDIFLIMLLPPIIFDSGYGMQRKVFYKNFGGILVYAFLGTLVSTLLVGLLTWAVGQIGFAKGFTAIESFAFGALISATDPVSVLATFKELHADPDLHSFIFGESIFNDAVSIVLFKVFMKMNTQMKADGSGLSAFAIFWAFLTFCWIFIMSTVVGALVACLCAWVTKKLDLRDGEHELTESAFVILMPWVAYLLSEAAGLSGIVAILFCGAFMGTYTYHNLSEAAQRTTVKFFNVMTMMAETIVFCYMGLALFTFHHPYSSVGIGLIIWTLVIVNIARAANIYGCSFLINLIRKTHKISKSFQFVMWFSGLRGAIAFCLALRCVSEFPTDEGLHGTGIFTVTLFYVMFTVLFVGSFMQPVLDKCGVLGANHKELSDPTESDKWDSTKASCCSEPKRFMLQLDARVIKPFLVNSAPLLSHHGGGHAHQSLESQPLHLEDHVTHEIGGHSDDEEFNGRLATSESVDGAREHRDSL